MVSRSQYNAIVKLIGDSLSNEILSKSVKNLSSLEFARETQMGYKHGSTKDKLPHNWTISNTGALARSGYKKSDRKRLRWEVGFDSPYAYYVNYGSGPGKNVPFANLYDWAYKRKKEIKKTFPALYFPSKKQEPEFWKFWERYSGTYTVKTKKHIKRMGKKSKLGSIGTSSVSSKFKKSIKGHRVEKIPFLFAYYVWRSIKKHGVPPTFFFSDAVYTSVRDVKKIITRAVRSKKTFVYDEGSESFSTRGHYAVKG